MLLPGRWDIPLGKIGTNVPPPGSGISIGVLDARGQCCAGHRSQSCRSLTKLEREPQASRSCWVEKPNLSKVDEVGFADLLPGSGHGWGGFVNVSRIEVYGTPVRRESR
jgi:hypothetical protein